MNRHFQSFVRPHSRAAKRLAGVLLASSLGLSACGGGSTAPETASSASATDSTDAPAEADSPLVGTFQTVAGGQIDLGSLEGQDTILWFWASW